VSGEVDQFSKGEMIAVALPQVERELAKLWRKVAEERKQAVTRACLWNLIVHTATDEGYQRSKKIIDEISPSVPARVLVLKTFGAGGELKAWIETNWHQGDGGKRQIGSDEITIEGPGGEDLAAVVRALLLPDVPTAALWADGAPQKESPLDRELLHSSDRIVVHGDGETGLRGLAAAIAVERHPVAAISMSWLRCGPWRQLVASQFDPPVPIEELFTVDKVTIECTPGRAGAALLFVGWLASRLRWREGRAMATRRYRFTRPRGEVEVELVLSDGAPDPFQQVTLTNPNGSYSVARDGATVIINTPSVACKQPLHFPSDAELWTHALSAQGRDPLFTDALKRLAAL
jgi:glucose-6-phosphate dehydrogenase assembly protein OpcA